MADSVLVSHQQSGLLARATRLYRSTCDRIDAAVGNKKKVTPTLVGGNDALDKVGMVTPSLAAILRPQAAYRWLLPYLASITPTYVESILRGALAGNHVQAWELFDLMIDTNPELAACVQEYVEGVLSHKIVFEPAHEEEEEPSDLAVEKCKVVSAALRNMRPDAANDENSLKGTLRDLLFARFHGQSVVEIDWLDTYGTGDRYIRKIKELGNVQCVRSTFWVHPVCYAWSIQGRLGLRGVLLSGLGEGSQYNPAWQMQKNSMGKMDLDMAGTAPAWNFITSQPRPSDLVAFPRNKFLISTFKSKAGTALGGSCLRSLAALWVYSNFCGDYLMNTAQLFQVPFRMAKYAPNTPPAVQHEMRQMLQSMGSTAWGLFPTGTELTFETVSSQGSQSPAAYLLHYVDDCIRKVVLHQTMSGGQHDSMGKGGGQAFGQVEQETKSQCIEAGSEFAAAQINEQLIPMILELNYGEDGDEEAPVCKLVDSEVGGLADAQKMQVLSTIMDVPTSHLRRMFQIPKPGPDDELAGVEQGSAGAQMKQSQENVEADRDQKVQAAKQQAAAIKIQQQKNGNGNLNQNGSGNGVPNPMQKQPGSDDNEGMDGRSANGKHRFNLDALEAKKIHVQFAQDGSDASSALHETIEPVLARIQAIEKVKDKDTRIRLMRKLLKDMPELTAALLHDDSLSKAIAPAIVKKFVKSLASKQKAGAK